MSGIDTQAFARSMNELLVLATLKEEPKHGYQVALDLEEKSGGTFILQHGTLYPILHRLEAEGLIEGAWDQGNAPRRRKVYTLTRRGRARMGEGAGEVTGVLRELLRVVGEPGDESLGVGLAAG